VPILILAVFIFFAFLIGLALLGGRQLVKRPLPDPADSPANYGLPFEEVTFSSHYKATLKGWWIPAPASPVGTVIFVHGRNGSMDGDLPQALPLYRAGYNVLLFNLRAHGTSSGKVVTYGVFEKEDVLGAIDFVRKEKGANQVALMGFSMGAGVALITAALTDKVAVLILDGVFWRFLDLIAAVLRARGMPLAGGLAQLFVFGATLLTNTRMYQVSPLLWAKHLKDVPTLFIHAEREQFTPLAAVERLAADLQAPYQIWVAPNSQHRDGFKDHPQAYSEQVLGWLARHYSS